MSNKENIFDKRIECYKKLTELTKIIKNVGEEYIEKLNLDKEMHPNILNRLEYYHNRYDFVYENCKKYILK